MFQTDILEVTIEFANLCVIIIRKYPISTSYQIVSESFMVFKRIRIKRLVVADSEAQSKQPQSRKTVRRIFYSSNLASYEKNETELFVLYGAYHLDIETNLEHVISFL
jgi:hypothetical protein